MEIKKMTYEEFQEKLRLKRELIKANRDYYGDKAPSQCRDYIRYKNFLKEGLK